MNQAIRIAFVIGGPPLWALIAWLLFDMARRSFR
jgi:hypothetical protein